MEKIQYLRIFFLSCLNAALYIPIVVLDIKRAAGSVTYTQGYFCDCFKYAAIISCLLICLFAYSHAHGRAARIQSIVFCFTLAADFFLLFTPFFSAGVIVFLGAHLSALIRYRPRWTPPAAACAVVLFTVIMLFLPGKLHTDTQDALFIAVTLTYAMLIISVTISTFFAEQPRKNTIFSRLGMLLFIGCDINVLFFNTLTPGSILYTAAIVLMWAFYLPAQTLLALSSVDLSRVFNVINTCKLLTYDTIKRNDRTAL